MMYDTRLKKAYELIENQQIDLLSIDIFDTLLWRKVPLPVDLFLLLGEKFKNEGWLINAVTTGNFAYLRHAAEQIARQKKGSELEQTHAEVTLNEIYWQLHGIFKKINLEELSSGKKGILNESDVDELVEIEIATEKQLLKIDQEILQLIQFANQHKIPVILVSDTYFDKRQIEKFIEPIHTLFKELFISSEYGFGKKTGLFSTIIDEYKIEANRYLHIGDNLKSDIKPAKQLGILTIHYEKYAQELSQVINQEWPEDVSQRIRQLDPQEGDFGISSLRSRVSNQTDFKGRQKALWQYGALILGPVMAGFASWGIQRCADLKEKQLLCLMREGQLYKKIIDSMAPSFSSTLETKELWVSRRFMMQSALMQANMEELMGLLSCHPLEPFTIETFCQLLGLDPAQMGKYKKYRHVRIEDFQFADDFLQYICSRYDLREEIVYQSSLRRKRFFNYFKTVVDLNKSDKITLLDVGWAGMTQGMLQRILFLEGYNIPIHGLYLGTTEKSQYSLLQGFIREGYLLRAGLPKDAAEAFRRGLYVLEQVAVSACGVGSLKDITDTQNIIHSTFVAKKQQVKEAAIVQAGIMNYCQLLCQEVQRGNIAWNSNSNQLEELLRQMLVRATAYPTNDEAKLFSRWANDFVSERAEGRQLANDPHYHQFAQAVLPAHENWNMVWPSAFAALNDHSLVKATAAVRLKKLPAASFLSQDYIPLKVRLIRKDKSEKAAPLILRSNANRKFYAFEKFWSIAQPIGQFELEFNLKQDLIRFDILRIKYYTMSQDVPYEIVSEGKALQRSEQAPLILTYELPHPDVYLIELELCCEVFNNS